MPSLVTPEEEIVISYLQKGYSIRQIKEELGRGHVDQVWAIIKRPHISKILDDLNREIDLRLDIEGVEAVNTWSNLMRFSDDEDIRLKAANNIIKARDMKLKRKGESEGSDGTPVRDFLDKIVKAGRGDITVNIQNNYKGEDE